ncbi:D-isomer specific 2-hydroxyacid dehydrogenase family protein [Adlercreutzia sp. ZJ473]|uniref:NAD(P)-dependent oxidoreductase n=1 Tax=Adlercreutzia sp. ZJ473 TaxID=2722822 RepID=UPI001555324A|nr:NAD(P)-dependent oxidoreductase [Adlercreutzia sp. ZJ473]
MPRILLGNCYDNASYKILKACVPTGYELFQLSEATQAALLEAIPEAEYLIASGRLKIDVGVIARAKKLRLVVRTGVGLDSIDLPALEAAGIPLRVNAGVNAESVAEHTLLLILAALRRLPEADRKVKAGEWPKRALGVASHELRGKKVFVAGLGNIGRRVVQLLGPFGCKVAGSDSLDRANLPVDFFDSDIVTLHCPLTQSTERLIDKDVVARLRPGCIIVNTARGGLVDEEALAEGLRSGCIGFACLDVRASEPSRDPAPFAGLDNVILTSHIAGITYESFESMMTGAVKNIVEFEEEYDSSCCEN